MKVWLEVDVSVEREIDKIGNLFDTSGLMIAYTIRRAQEWNAEHPQSNGVSAERLEIAKEIFVRCVEPLNTTKDWVEVETIAEGCFQCADILLAASVQPKEKP